MWARRVVPVGVTRTVVPVTVEQTIVRPVVGVTAQEETRRQPGEASQFMPYLISIEEITPKGRFPP